MKPHVVFWIGLFGILGIGVVLLLVLGGGYLQARLIPVSPAEERIDVTVGEECTRTCEQSCAGFPSASDTRQCLRECRGWCEESPDD